MAPAPALTRHCYRCERDLPIVEFERGKDYCRACQTPPAGPYRRCKRCRQEKPSTAFRVRCSICNACREAAATALEESRTCAECGQEKPLAEFGKKAGRDNPGGRRPFCRDCGKRKRAEGIRRHHAAKRAAAPVVPHKTCTRCDKSKPVTDFAPYDGTIDKLDFLCHDCRALATAERAARATRHPNGQPRTPVAAAAAEGGT